MSLSISAYGNVDALHGVFNAIAMVSSSAGFEHMVRTGVLLGFAVVATLVAFPGGLQRGWNWILAVLVISGVLLLPKEQVSIEDRTGREAAITVDGVPWTLAMLASVKSAIGAELTQLFETAFQTIPTASRTLPAELSYLANGMMFGSRLVRSSREAQALSAYDQTDLVQYIRNCVFPQIGRGGEADAVAKSKALITDFADTNEALSSTYHDPANGFVEVMDNCPAVWRAIVGRINAAGATAVAQAAATQMPTLYRADSAAAVATVDAGIAAVYTKAALADASATAAEIMVQNILINATADAAAQQSAALGDSATIMLAQMRAQATAQMNAGNLVQGRIAEEALPVVRNITEAVLFAMFPVLCILLVASEGRAMGALFKGYVYALVWVELWPPMFAIVNYLQTLEATRQLAGAAFLSGTTTGLSISTASEVYGRSVSSLATAAWMTTFVPVLAAACLFGFDRVMQITGTFGGGLRGAQAEAGAATKGNLALGNVSLGQQQLSAYRSSPAMLRTESVGGMEVSNAITGERVSSYRDAGLLVSPQLAQTLAQGRSKAAEVAIGTAQRHAKAAETALDAAFNTARSASQSSGASVSKSLGWDVSKVGSNGLMVGEDRALAEKIARDHKIDDSSAVQKALSLGLTVGPGGLGDVVKRTLADIVPGVTARGESMDVERLSTSIADGVDALKRTSTQRRHDLVDQFRRGEAFEEVRRSNREAAQRVESSARNSQAYRESEMVELSHAQRITEKWDGMVRFAQDNKASFNVLFDRFMQTRGRSVHDGVADPRRQMEDLKAFSETGSLRFDTKDGAPLWLPVGDGPAPFIAFGVGGADLDALRTGDRQAMERQFQAAAPDGGSSAVRKAVGRFDGREHAREAALGVSSTSDTKPGSIKARVEGGHQQAQAARAGAQKEISAGAGNLQTAQDVAKGGISDHHRPATGRNNALDSTRHSERLFSGEAEAEKDRQADLLRNLSGSKIPK